MAGGVAGGRDRLDLEAAAGELAAVLDRLRDLLVDLGRRVGVGDQRRAAEPLAGLRQPGDVVDMGVGDEDVGDLDPVALGPLEQRVEHVVAVDQDALADSSSATR